jgi:hypothetical protein
MIQFAYQTPLLGIPSCSLSVLPYLNPTMDNRNKAVLTDLQAYDTDALKGRLGELRRYL